MSPPSNRPHRRGCGRSSCAHQCGRRGPAAQRARAAYLRRSRSAAHAGTYGCRSSLLCAIVRRASGSKRPSRRIPPSRRAIRRSPRRSSAPRRWQHPGQRRERAPFRQTLSMKGLFLSFIFSSFLSIRSRLSWPQQALCHPHRDFFRSRPRRRPPRQARGCHEDPSRRRRRR